MTSRKQYYQTHKKERLAYQEQYYQDHKAEVLAKRKEHYQTHKSKMLAKRKQYKQRIKHEVLDHYSALRGKQDWDGSEIKSLCCGCCQEDDLSKLCIDHIAGGGAAHRRSLKRCSHDFYLWLLQQGYPEGYQTLCLDCNDKKKRWDGEAKGKVGRPKKKVIM